MLVRCAYSASPLALRRLPVRWSGTATRNTRPLSCLPCVVLRFQSAGPMGLLRVFRGLCGPPRFRACKGGTTRTARMMPTVQEQLCEDVVQCAAPQGAGAVSQRDPHQSVPPGCVVVRFRSPGEGCLPSAGIAQFRQRAEGFAACKTFVARWDTPREWRIHFPRETPAAFSVPNVCRGASGRPASVAPVAPHCARLVALWAVQR